MEKSYWFKRRRYGWGWVPVSWQGWLSVVTFVVVIIAAATAFLPETNDDSGELGMFVLTAMCALGALLIMTHRHGPPPKWRWGRKPNDNPDIDW